MIDRRDFLKAFGVGLAAFSVDPERLLWVPGAKTIFIPPDAGKVEAYDLDDMQALLKLNQLTFGLLYTNPEDVLIESKKTNKDPFKLYFDNYWVRKDL